MLYITEYPFQGEVGNSSPKEPPTRVQAVKPGKVSEPLHKDTHLVTLYTTEPARFAFVTDGKVPEQGTPIDEHYEIPRLVHPSGTLRVAVLKGIPS
jgi:hypothetical protein